ncbi:hypothetical protein JHL17_21400 [Azospirillum sp. YIM B02556]|uniref:Uncharacterized protein n=1 Tax=Azospirillum endophyticum TaxID=2800326 RepID=A0ABS1F975_9PROT|nr:hypothetical protein [Azospirillum endophyticum]MBK1839966.1 hypothetical protein [Azospirillum endophyticum]
MTTLANWPASDLDVRTRQLRERDMLPKGGRGLHAPDIGPDHAATILIAMASASKAVDAGVRVLDYWGLASAAIVDGLGAATFHDGLTAVLSDPALANRVDHVRVCRSWPEARISIQGAELVYRNPCAPIDKSHVREDLTFDGALIHQLAIVLKTGGASAAYQE